MHVLEFFHNSAPIRSDQHYLFPDLRLQNAHLVAHRLVVAGLVSGGIIPLASLDPFLDFFWSVHYWVSFLGDGLGLLIKQFLIFFFFLIRSVRSQIFPSEMIAGIIIVVLAITVLL